MSNLFNWNCCLVIALYWKMTNVFLSFRLHYSRCQNTQINSDSGSNNILYCDISSDSMMSSLQTVFIAALLSIRLRWLPEWHRVLNKYLCTSLKKLSFLSFKNKDINQYIAIHCDPDTGACSVYPHCMFSSQNSKVRLTTHVWSTKCPHGLFIW